MGDKINKLYYRFLYLLYTQPIINIFAHIESETKTHINMFSIHWTERYYMKLEYFQRKIKGENITYLEVKQEHINEFYKILEEWENKK